MPTPKIDAAEIIEESKPRFKGGLYWILSMFSMMILGYFALAMLIIIVFGMAPTFVAAAIDEDRDRAFTVTVGMCNFCGVLPFLVDVWHEGMALQASIQILQNSMSWLTMLIAASIGWGLSSMMPQAMRIVLRSQARMRISRLQRRMAYLNEIWGGELKKEIEKDM